MIIRDKPSCPLCRQTISANSLIDPPPPAAAAADQDPGHPDQQNLGQGSGSQIAADPTAGSSKVKALLQKLREVQQQDAAAAAAAGGVAAAPTKSVVFSQFIGEHLALIRSRISENASSCCCMWSQHPRVAAADTTRSNSCCALKPWRSVTGLSISAFQATCVMCCCRYA